MTSPDVPARRPGRPRDAAVEGHVFEATLALLVEHGYASLSVERIAERAGVSKATIYRRWPTKDALVLAAMQESVGRRVDDSGHGLEGLRVVFLSLVEVIGSGFGPIIVQLSAAVSCDENLRGTLHAHAEEMRSPTRRMIVEAQDAGDIDPTLDPDLVAEMMAGTVFYRLLIGLPPLSRREAEIVFDRVMRGCRPG
jgi:AcrR family transcriptional regulator